MAKDPKDMTDEELDAAIANPPVETEIPPVEVPVVPEKEEKKDDKKEPEKEPEAVIPDPKEEPKEEPPEEKPVSRREQLRVQELLERFKNNLQTPAPAPAVDPNLLDYSKNLEGDPELIKKLELDRQAAMDSAQARGLATANSIRFHTRLEIDAPRIEAKYPQLDKTSDKFNPVLANAMNTMFLSTAGYDAKTGTAANPDIRYLDYVESIFELAGEIAGEEVDKKTKNIKKQAAQTGLRPDGSGVKTLDLNKLPQDMTDEELDARIALAIPSTPRR